MPPEPAPSHSLSLQEVRHVAALARLELSDDQIERLAPQLASIIDYVALLTELDVEGVEPLTHPSRTVSGMNRLEQDDPRPGLPLPGLTQNAPAMEGRFLAVPKVIAEAGDSGGG